MIKGYSTEVLKVYEKIRDEEETALKSRRKEIETSIPQVIQIEEQIATICIDVSIASFKKVNNRDLYLNALKEKITELRIKKAELLMSNGYPNDYLDMHYKCNKCNDTGFIGTEKCSCYKDILVNIYYRNSDLRSILKENNFDKFNINYYSSEKKADEPNSARKNMESILEKAMNFQSTFDDTNENLLFYGSSGTGKTFLSYCIARELLDRGYLVLYRTAEQLIKDLRSVRFDNDTNLEELLINCDLLIIDDLGTESISDFSRSELFNLLNTKLLKNKKMLVSTNYSLDILFKNYSERITSRLIGNFTMCKFYGDDIRIKKNLPSLK